MIVKRAESCFFKFRQNKFSFLKKKILIIYFVANSNDIFYTFLGKMQICKMHSKKKISQSVSSLEGIDRFEVLNEK